MIRIFQLDSDPSFRQRTEEYCRGLRDFQYQGADQAEALVRAFRGDRPHCILLDMDLQPEGGLSVLKGIRNGFSCSDVKIIVLSLNQETDTTLSRALNLGADYFVQRPVDLAILEKRIRQMVAFAERQRPREMTLRQVQEICSGYFERMGVPPHFKGYRYLIEGIWLGFLHPSWLCSVTQNLYPAIGQRFGVSGAQVERAMRYALDVTWEKGNVDQLYKFFPYVSEQKGKPTNSCFIAKIVDLVALEGGPYG
ncbi:MAG TPA: hypothetical protein DDW87_07050 [Firmicutes bacterium]|nr:hypothetical protein [Bacillota bacterium]